MGLMDTRNVVAFAGGALVTLAVTKWVVPMTAQALGSRSGAKALDALVAEHGALLRTLDAMIESDDNDPAKRWRLFHQAKIALTAHALAEEDVVYPLIADVGGDEPKMRELFSEHGEMKRLLAELEREPKDQPPWRETARKLRAIVADHARDEEPYALPKLRAALSQKDAAFLGGGVQREQALLL